MLPSRASQVRSTPVTLPERSVTAAIRAGQFPAGLGHRHGSSSWDGNGAREIPTERDAARSKVGFGESAADVARSGEEPAGRLALFARRVVARRGNEVPGLVQKGARFFEGVAEIRMAPVERNKVEQVAMLGRGGVHPFAGGAAPAVRSREADEETAPRIVVHSPQPVVAASTALRRYSLQTASAFSARRAASDAASLIMASPRRPCIKAPTGAACLGAWPPDRSARDHRTCCSPLR